jgi:hypothetical protein
MLLRFAAVGLSALVLACADQSLPTTREFKLDVTTNASAAPLNALNFVAHPIGANEVPARDTRAQGQATFNLSADGTTMTYRVTVAGITNVVASHIHIGPLGANGPVAVFLFGNAPPGGGPVNGVLAEGTFTAANFIGPLLGLTMNDLIAELQAGNAYVNVHTNDGVGATNTGPGDFPGGEIRDQVGGGHVDH